MSTVLDGVEIWNKMKDNMDMYSEQELNIFREYKKGYQESLEEIKNAKDP